jgi:hypothetical protein
MNLTKIIQIALTVFYGQLLSIAVYDNFLQGIPSLIQDNTSHYQYIRVALGVLIIINAFVSLVAIWKKYFSYIFMSGFILIIIYLCYIVITTINLALTYENISTLEKTTGVVDIAIKSINLIFGIFVTFLMSFRGPYNIVPADLEDEDNETHQRKERLSLNCCSSKRCCFCFRIE